MNVTARDKTNGTGITAGIVGELGYPLCSSRRISAVRYTFRGTT